MRAMRGRAGSTLLLVAGFVLMAAVARAGMPEDDILGAYLDDRSSPEAVIHSLYNAVSRGEYPRAWSYFDAASRPDYDHFARGYGDTRHVRVKTAAGIAEGAAGTFWWAIPTVIEAERVDGSTAVYAGCHILNMTNPKNYDRPPYDPIAIVRGRLRPVDQPFESAEGDCRGM